MYIYIYTHSCLLYSIYYVYMLFDNKRTLYPSGHQSCHCLEVCEAATRADADADGCCLFEASRFDRVTTRSATVALRIPFGDHPLNLER